MTVDDISVMCYCHLLTLICKDFFRISYVLVVANAIYFHCCTQECTAKKLELQIHHLAWSHQIWCRTIYV